MANSNMGYVAPTLSPQFLSTLGQMVHQNTLSGTALGSMKGLSPDLKTSGIGKLLLQTGPGLGGGIKATGPRNTAGPSVISRILDVLSRPLYAVGASAYEAAGAAANHKNLLDQFKALGSGAISGLEGKEKITPADWIQQSHDIQAQKQKTGSSSGWQPGQGKGLNLAEKAAGFGLNLVSDPLNKIAPVGIARSIGEKTGLYTIPTVADISRKVLGATPAKQATNAALSEAGTNLGGIQIPHVASGTNAGNALGESFKSKFGEVPAPTDLTKLNHPLINTTVENGTIKSAGLTPVGETTARNALTAHSDRMSQVLARINEIKAAKLTKNNPEFTSLKKEFNAGRKNFYPSSFQKQVESHALGQLNDVKTARDFSQKAWVNKVVNEGVDRNAAQRIVNDVNSGRTFNEAVANSIKPSTKILKASELGAGEKGFQGLKPGFKLSSVLAPSVHEVLSAAEKSSPAGRIVSAPEAEMRNKALSMPLGPNAQRIKDEVKPLVIKGIAEKGGGAFNSIPQSNMWNTIRIEVQKLRSKTPGKTAAQFPLINGATFHIAAHLENELENEGHRAVDLHGNPARITEAVIHTGEFPNKLSNLTREIVDKYAADQKAGALSKASQAVSDAKIVQPVVQEGLKIGASLDKRPELSDPLKFLGKQQTASGVEKAILQITGSSRAARAGKEIYKAISENANTSSMDALSKAGNLLTEIVKTGKIPANYGRHIAELGKGIARDLGIPDPKLAGQMLAPYAKAEEGFLGRMATWYGQHDLRPFVLARTAEARINAALWGKAYSDAFKGLTKEQRVEAFRAAQGLFTPANDSVAKAADAIRARMENLFSASGIRESVLKGNTQAFRAGLTIKELNGELKRMGSDFRFTDAKDAKNLFGDTVDYSKEADWLKSWESHELKGRPEKFLAQMETAIWNALGKRALYDEFINRFGSFSRNAEQYVGIRDFPLLAGHYFHPEIAQQIQRVNRDLFTNQFKQNEFLRLIDNVIRMWKTNVTIYSPSHSIHNGMGDIINSFLFAGVRNPNAYRKAISVLRAHANDYRDFEKLAPYLNPETLPAGIAKSVPGSRVIATTKDGQAVTIDQIYMAAHREGILQAARDIEDISFGSIPHIQPFGGRVRNFAHRVVQGMDHFTRLGHFIDAVSKGSGQLNEVFRNAGNEVRRIHPDGMDLTDFERNVLRRIVPFYSWSRKTIPFMVQGLLAKPSKFMIYPKFSYEFVQGQPGTNLSQQFPSNQIFPGWIQDMGIGPMGGPGGILNTITGAPRGFVESSLSVPPMDVLQTYHNPLGGVLGSLNPLIKAPIELYQGQQIDTGAPTGGTLQYLGSQAPSIGLLQRLSNVGLGGVTQKGQQQGIGNQQAIVNYLTGLKLVNTGNYVKQANYEQRQREKGQARSNAQKILTAIQAAKAGE